MIPGDEQPAAVHALAHAINEALGNAGRTVVTTEPVLARPQDQAQSLAELVADMEAGQVDVLVILGGNPVYDAPADLDFETRLRQVPLRIHLSAYNDETSERCQWHLPEAHFLESWSDTLECAMDLRLYWWPPNPFFSDSPRSTWLHRFLERGHDRAAIQVGGEEHAL